MTGMRCCGLLLILLMLTACSQRDGLAPVVEVKWRDANLHVQQHIVERGETLYAIAFRYDQDYRQLAVANHLASPYTLYVGQVIYLNHKHQSVYSTPRTTQLAPMYSSNRTVSTKLPRNTSGWLWPIKGQVLATFQPKQGKKGIDIRGEKGALVHASSAGTVAYAGSGLAGYGNLIIIKHNHQFLTAYSNNARNLVKEGQHIKAGQPIAEVGVVNRRYWGMHFEIRKAGKPVNPLDYLQRG